MSASARGDFLGVAILLITVCSIAAAIIGIISNRIDDARGRRACYPQQLVDAFRHGDTPYAVCAVDGGLVIRRVK